MPVPRAAGGRHRRIDLETAAVPLRLPDLPGHVLVHLLRLDRRHRLQPDEEDVVRRAFGGGPLGDGEVLALLGANAQRVPDRLGVGLPPGVAELLVDLPPGGRLVQFDQRRRLAGAFENGFHLGGRLQGDGGLDLGQLLIERLALGLQTRRTFSREIQSDLQLGVRALGCGLGVSSAFRLPGRGELELLDLLGLREGVLTKPVEFGDQGGRGGGRVWRRDERAVRLLRVSERAVEPDRQLSGHSQVVECVGLGARALVHRRIPGLPKGVEQVEGVGRGGPAVAKQVQHRDLVVGWRGSDPDVGAGLPG